MKKQITYSSALAEIEEIVSNIENEKYEIDELAEKVKRVAQLIEFCKEKLHETEKEVSNILKSAENKKEKG